MYYSEAADVWNGMNKSVDCMDTAYSLQGRVSEASCFGA